MVPHDPSPVYNAPHPLHCHSWSLCVSETLVCTHTTRDSHQCCWSWEPLKFQRYPGASLNIKMTSYQYGGTCIMEFLMKTHNFINYIVMIFSISCLSRKATCLERWHNFVVTLYRLHCIGRTKWPSWVELHCWAQVILLCRWENLMIIWSP